MATETTLSEALAARVPGWTYHLEPIGDRGTWLCWGVWAPVLADQGDGEWLAPPWPSPSVRCYSGSPEGAVAALTRALGGTKSY